MVDSTIVYEKKSGFTLIEIAMVLLIVGLFFGVGVSTLGGYLDNAKQNHTMNNLKSIKQAMLDYVLVNYHMPCPSATFDGTEDREVDGACRVATGYVPYRDLGRSKEVASDDYGNVFLYGINSAATDVSKMSSMAGDAEQEMHGASAASYFANVEVLSAANTDAQNHSSITPVNMPIFGLDTPPTSMEGGEASNNYRIYQKDSNYNGPWEEVTAVLESFPAVILALNENGFGVNLTTCMNTERSNAESENCDNDTLLKKANFNEHFYDDIILGISAYEIKQQVLDRLNDLVLASPPGVGSLYGNYDVIYLRNVTNANDINGLDNTDNRVYIGVKRDENNVQVGQDENDSGNADFSGNLETSAVFKNGNDEIYIEGSVTSSGSLNMGDGDDTATILGSIQNASKVWGGKGVDRLYISQTSYPLEGMTEEARLESVFESNNAIKGFEFVCYQDTLHCWSADQ